MSQEVGRSGWCSVDYRTKINLGIIFILVLVPYPFAVQVVANSKSLVQIHFLENPRFSKFKSGR